MQESLIETVARPEHEPVLAKLHRPVIAIDSGVLDRKDRHRRPSNDPWHVYINLVPNRTLNELFPLLAILPAVVVKTQPLAALSDGSSHSSRKLTASQRWTPPRGSWRSFLRFEVASSCTRSHDANRGRVYNGHANDCDLRFGDWALSQS